MVFVCLTCTQPGAQKPSSTGVGAGLCFDCAQTCHRALSHRVECIGIKRSFRCTFVLSGCGSFFWVQLRLRQGGQIPVRLSALDHGPRSLRRENGPFRPDPNPTDHQLM
jgi:hypothetical protein